jgi:hypothetical protein
MKLVRLARSYAFVFYILERFFHVILDDGFSEWKAVTILVMIESLALVTVLALMGNVWPRGWDALQTFRFPVLALAVLAISIGNYRALIYQQRWRRFEVEFRAIPLPFRMVTAAAMVLLVVLIYFALSASRDLRLHGLH